MSGAGLELEACLVVLGDARAELCASLAVRRTCAGLELGEFERRSLRDRYYDTPGGALVAADMALRLRSRSTPAGTLELMTWKGPSRRAGRSGVGRAELEGPASRELLGELLEALRAGGVQLPAVRGDQLRPTHEGLVALGFEVVQTRHTERSAASLRAVDGGELCELAIDRVRYELAGRSLLHHELEFEASGQTTLERVEALAAQLTGEFAGELRPWPWSKTALGRALEGLEQRGELAALLEGEQLAAQGYDAVEALLRAR